MKNILEIFLSLIINVSQRFSQLVHFFMGINSPNHWQQDERNMKNYEKT